MENVIMVVTIARNAIMTMAIAMNGMQNIQIVGLTMCYYSEMVDAMDYHTIPKNVIMTVVIVYQ